MTLGARSLPGGLLVSVRSVEEAAAARSGGAAIIDVKEPSRGPLGRADAEVAAAIALRVGPTAACTLACGELAEGWQAIASHVHRIHGLLAAARGRLSAVKAGPAGMDEAEWLTAFTALAGALPSGVELVAVAYADWQTAASPAPPRLIAAAAAVGAATLLIDTFDKQGPGLFGAAPVPEVASWLEAARSAGIRVALAGRLDARECGTALALGAVIVGVRTAACAGGRMGSVEERKVAALVGTLAEAWRESVPVPPRNNHHEVDGSQNPAQSRAG